MKLNLKATNIELTEAIRAYLNERLGAVAKLLPEGNEEEAIVQVELGKATKHHRHGEVFRAELNFRFSGDRLRAVATETDLYAAIDLAKDELLGELKSRRGRRQTLLRRGGRRLKNFIRGFYH